MLCPPSTFIHMMLLFVDNRIHKTKDWPSTEGNSNYSYGIEVVQKEIKSNSNGNKMQ